MSNSPALLTIGYEQKTLPAYLAELRAGGVTLLCDVRRNPISRKPGFSRRRLAEACAAEGIRYEHLPQLGIASSDRKNIKTAEDRADLFERYARVTLSQERDALGAIRTWVVADRERVALTCFERDACECHRSRIAEVLAAEGLRELQPVHL